MDYCIIWDEETEIGTEYSIVDGKIQKRNLIRQTKAIELTIQSYLSTLLRGDGACLTIYYLQCAYPKIAITKRLLDIIKEKCIYAITSKYNNDGSDASFASIIKNGCVECGKWKGFVYVPCGHIYCESHIRSFQKCGVCECVPTRIFIYENATWDMVTVALILFQVQIEMFKEEE